jgi:hypothetical protein
MHMTIFELQHGLSPSSNWLFRNLFLPGRQSSLGRSRVHPNGGLQTRIWSSIWSVNSIAEMSGACKTSLTPSSGSSRPTRAKWCRKVHADTLHWQPSLAPHAAECYGTAPIFCHRPIRFAWFSVTCHRTLASIRISPLSNSSNTLPLSKVWRIPRRAAASTIRSCRFDELLAVVNFKRRPELSPGWISWRHAPACGHCAGTAQRMNPPQASTPKSGCDTAIFSRSFLASASSFFPPTSSLTSKPWPPTSPS